MKPKDQSPNIGESMNLDSAPPSGPGPQMVFLILRHAVRIGAKDVQVIYGPGKTNVIFKAADGSVVNQLSLDASLGKPLVIIAQGFAKMPLNAENGSLTVVHGKQNVHVRLGISRSSAGSVLRLEIGNVPPVKTKEALQEKEVFAGHIRKAERDYLMGNKGGGLKRRTRIVQIRAWLLLIILPLLLFAGYLTSQTIKKYSERKHVAIVTHMGGKPTVASGNRGPVLLKGKDKISEQETLSTVSAEQVGTIDLAFSDKSALRILENSSVLINRLPGGDPEQKIHINLLKGKILVNVQNLNDKKTRFRVSTVNALIGVKGTTLSVSFENPATTLGVLDGEVVILNISDPDIKKLLATDIEDLGDDDLKKLGLTIGPGKSIEVKGIEKLLAKDIEDLTEDDRQQLSLIKGNNYADSSGLLDIIEECLSEIPEEIEGLISSLSSTLSSSPGGAVGASKVDDINPAYLKEIYSDIRILQLEAANFVIKNGRTPQNPGELQVGEETKIDPCGKEYIFELKGDYLWIHTACPDGKDRPELTESSKK